MIPTSEKWNRIIPKEQENQKFGQQPTDHCREQGVTDLHDGGHHDNYLEITTLYGALYKRMIVSGQMSKKRVVPLADFNEGNRVPVHALCTSLKTQKFKKHKSLIAEAEE